MWLAAKNHILNWPVGILSVFLYFKVFFSTQLYSDAILQLVFALFQIYGWWNWSKKNQESARISLFNKNDWFFAAFVIPTGTAIWYFILLSIADKPSYPFWDSFTTVISLVAIYFQARRKIQSWWLWIFVDLIYLPLYVAKELYLTAVLYSVFLVLALYGLAQWNKLIKSQNLVQPISH